MPHFSANTLQSAEFYYLKGEYFEALIYGTSPGTNLRGSPNSCKSSRTHKREAKCRNLPNMPKNLGQRTFTTFGQTCDFAAKTRNYVRNRHPLQSVTT